MADGRHNSYEEKQISRLSEERNELLETVDDLTTIVISVMQTLEEVGQEDFVLLKNPGVRQWWHDHKVAELAKAEEFLRKSRQDVVTQYSVTQDYEKTLKIAESQYEAMKEKLKL